MINENVWSVSKMTKSANNHQPQSGVVFQKTEYKLQIPESNIVGAPGVMSFEVLPSNHHTLITEFMKETRHDLPFVL